MLNQKTSSCRVVSGLMAPLTQQHHDAELPDDSPHAFVPWRCWQWPSSGIQHMCVCCVHLHPLLGTLCQPYCWFTLFMQRPGPWSDDVCTALACLLWRRSLFSSLKVHKEEYIQVCQPWLACGQQTALKAGFVYVSPYTCAYSHCLGYSFTWLSWVLLYMT